MQINLTTKEFRHLLDMVYIGNWVLNSTRGDDRFAAYDDLESWRSIYPVEVFEEQFRKLCEGWEKGLALLPEGDDSEVSVMAHTAYCIFKSSLNQIRFIRARDEGRFDDCIKLAEDEERIARLMLVQMNKNAAIGYEASNHYYFSKGQIVEKILNCRYVAEYFSERQKL